MLATTAVACTAGVAIACGYQSYRNSRLSDEEQRRRNLQIAQFRQVNNFAVSQQQSDEIPRDVGTANAEIVTDVETVAAVTDSSSRIKKKAVSFDLFDTLVGRDVPTPDSIFNLVEEKIKIPGFATARRRAQKIICGPNCAGGIADVYQHLREEYNILAGQDIEWQTELEHVVLIRSNIEKMLTTPADTAIIIVSDTLYDACKLREMLTLLKFPRLDEINIFASRSGKGDGWIWEVLNEVYDIVSHTGDDSKADVQSAINSNVVRSVVHSTMAHSPTAAENLMFDMSETAYGSIIRRLSLGNPYTFENDREKFFWHRLHASYTIPIFWYFLQSIRKVLETETNLTHITAVARDCILLEPLIEKYLLGGEGKNIFTDSSTGRQRVVTLSRLDTSRRLLRIQLDTPNEDYLSYMRESLGGGVSLSEGKTLVIDINGTYQRISRVTRKYFGTVPRAHFLSIQFGALFTDIPRGILTAAIPGIDTNILEKMNSTNYGSLVDWIGTVNDYPFGGPVRVPCEYKDELIDLTRKMILEDSPKLLGITLPSPQIIRLLLGQASNLGTELLLFNDQPIFQSLIHDSRHPETARKMDLALRFSQVLSKYHNRPSKNPVVLYDDRGGKDKQLLPWTEYMRDRIIISDSVDDDNPDIIVLSNQIYPDLTEYWQKTKSILAIVYENSSIPPSLSSLGEEPRIKWELSGGANLYIFYKPEPELKLDLPPGASRIQKEGCIIPQPRIHAVGRKAVPVDCEDSDIDISLLPEVPGN